MCFISICVGNNVYNWQVNYKYLHSQEEGTAPN